MPKYGYLVVEGPHDVEFVYRLLSPFGLKRVRLEKDLDAFFNPLIPRTFPQADGELQKRMPVPLFLQSESHAISVHSAGGDTRLVEVVEENRLLLEHDRVTGVGILLDSDNAVPAVDRFKTIQDAMGQKGFALPENPGEISTDKPRYGAYVLPDNNVQGTLEELLLETASNVYPALLASAEEHVDAALLDKTLTTDDTRDILKPAGRNKAVVGAMASVLRPGKAVQVSIQDNRWFRGEALKLPRIKAVQDFLVNLLELA